MAKEYKNEAKKRNIPFICTKRYIIEYQDNDNVYVYKPTMQDFIKIMEENLKEKYCL